MNLIYTLFIILSSLIPTKTEVYNELILQEVKHPEIVLKQAILETNSGQTGVGKTHNNKLAFRTKSGYIKFDNWQQSVVYYKQWQDKHYKEGDYYQFLSCMYKVNGQCVSYSTSKEYINKLKSIKI